MTTLTVANNRWYYAVPVLGWIARDVIEGEPENFWYALGAVASLWLIAIVELGIIALYLPMVLLTPVVMLLLILISRG